MFTGSYSNPTDDFFFLSAEAKEIILRLSDMLDLNERVASDLFISVHDLFVELIECLSFFSISIGRFASQCEA